MSLGVKKAEAVSDLICILVFDMKLTIITGILQCCDSYFADLAYVSVKYMPREQKNDHPSECTGKQNINWISPLLRDHSHCKENHTIFSRPLKFKNTFLKWPCFYSRHSWNTVDTTWNAINSINHWSHRGLRSATSCGASLSRLWGDREVPLGESGPVPVSGGVHADGAPRQHAGPLYPSALGGTSDVLQASVHVTFQIKNIIMANLIKLYYHFPNSVTLRFSERSKIFTLRS